MELSEHFAFGENWSQYASGINQDHLDQATRCLTDLLGDKSLDGVRMLDIGCGSGIHSVAAASLGAEVIATDLDPKSVATTSMLCEKFGVQDKVTPNIKSVFDLDPKVDGTFDLVYSWGVLHHTGAMWDAITSASRCVTPGGRFALALYRKTRCCGMWTIEKKAYARMPRLLQLPIQVAYTAGADAIASAWRRTLPWKLHQDYKNSRGMSRWHDVHDWLGGYPYESARPGEVESFLANQGFEKERGNRDHDQKVNWSFLGTGCAEYVFRKAQPEAP